MAVVAPPPPMITLTSDSLNALDTTLKLRSPTVDRVNAWRRDLVDVLDLCRHSLNTTVSSVASDPVVSLVKRLNQSISTNDEEFKKELKLQLAKDKATLARMSILSNELSQVELSPVAPLFSSSLGHASVEDHDGDNNKELPLLPPTSPGARSLSFLDLDSPPASPVSPSSLFLLRERETKDVTTTTTSGGAVGSRARETGGHDVPTKAAELLGLPNWIAPKIVKRGDVPHLLARKPTAVSGHRKKKQQYRRLCLGGQSTQSLDMGERARTLETPQHAHARSKSVPVARTLGSLLSSLVHTIEHKILPIPPSPTPSVAHDEDVDSSPIAAGLFMTSESQIHLLSPRSSPLPGSPVTLATLHSTATVVDPSTVRAWLDRSYAHRSPAPPLLLKRTQIGDVDFERQPPRQGSSARNVGPRWHPPREWLTDVPPYSPGLPSLSARSRSPASPRMGQM